jgi:type VII secretion effector (TIGR04197 family)
MSDHQLGPQPDIPLMSQYHHRIGDEWQKFMNTPQFDANNSVSNALQQLNTTVQQLSTTVQQLSTRITHMDTKIDTVIQRMDTFEIQQRAR